MFSSGNDLNNFGTALSSGQSLDQVAEQGRIMLQDFVRTILLCSKILIAAVNGDGVGIMFTVLPLFDLVFCVHGAKFNAPFSRLVFHLFNLVFCVPGARFNAPFSRLVFQLFNLVFCVPGARFNTPFSRLVFQIFNLVFCVPGAKFNAPFSRFGFPLI